MMIGSREASSALQDRASRKENIPMTSPTTHVRMMVNPTQMASVQPQQYIQQQPQGQIYSRVLQKQKMEMTQQPNSPRIYINTSPVKPEPTRHRIIELGGSKEKKCLTRSSRDKSVSNEVSNQHSKTQDFPSNYGNSAEESWKRKVNLLENRVKELHLEKQCLAVSLNNKIHELDSENKKLVRMLEDAEQANTYRSNASPSNSRVNKECEATSSDFGKTQEFNLEDMLANQIEVNLGLR